MDLTDIKRTQREYYKQLKGKIFITQMEVQIPQEI